jgi:PAS domain S-box-containing protein
MEFFKRLFGSLLTRDLIVSLLVTAVFISALVYLDNHTVRKNEKEHAVALFNQNYQLADKIQQIVNIYYKSPNDNIRDSLLENLAEANNLKYLIIFTGDKISFAYKYRQGDSTNFFVSDDSDKWIKEKRTYKYSFPLLGTSQQNAFIYFAFQNGTLPKEWADILFGNIYLIGGIALLVFLITILVQFAANYKLNNILYAIKKIVSGNPDYKVKAGKKGKLNSFAKSLNIISDNLTESTTRVNALSYELKSIFRDKVSELNLEINQRKKAEISLRQSEEQFRLLFERAPVGMFLTSPAGFITKTNRAFCDLLSYTEKELIGMNMKQFTHSDEWFKEEFVRKRMLKEEVYEFYNDPKIDRNILYALIKTYPEDMAIKEISMEKKFVNKQGLVVDCFKKAILIKDQKDNPVSFLEQVIDISERKKFEKELIVAKDRAEESDRLKSAFLAQISHEIRTPLNVILNCTTLITDELDEKYRNELEDLLEAINSAGKRLQRTINLTLDLSSVQSGNYAPEFEVFDLYEDLKKFHDEFIVLANQRNLSLNLIRNSNDTKITGDKYTINQVFQNLIDNAIKYTKKGKIDITIEKEEGNVCVRIADSGIGMSQEYLKDIFIPFSQEDVGQKREFEGNGLGLALVKNYVELNNGKVLVESQKGVGSVFTVYLPCGADKKNITVTT